jgi:hypothetical protein
MAANRSFDPNHPVFSRYPNCTKRFACAALGRRQSHKLRWRRIRSHISERAFSFKKW